MIGGLARLAWPELVVGLALAATEDCRWILRCAQDDKLGRRAESVARCPGRAMISSAGRPARTNAAICRMAGSICVKNLRYEAHK